MTMARQFQPSATFRGLRHVPLVALSRNSLYPALHMDGASVVIRVIRRHALAIDDLAAVDVRWRLAHQVTLVPRKGPWTFSANFFDRVAAFSFLAALEERGAPLTVRARAFLEGTAP